MLHPARERKTLPLTFDIALPAIEVSAAGSIDSTPYHSPAKVIAFAFPLSLTTNPFPVFAAYGGLLTVPENPKRKAIL